MDCRFILLAFISGYYEQITRKNDEKPDFVFIVCVSNGRPHRL